MIIKHAPDSGCDGWPLLSGTLDEYHELTLECGAATAAAEAEDYSDHTIRSEHERCAPHWCPLRRGAVTVEAE